MFITVICYPEQYLSNIYCRVGACQLRLHVNRDLQDIFTIALAVTSIISSTEIPGHVTLSCLLQGDAIRVGKQKYAVPLGDLPFCLLAVKIKLSMLSLVPPDISLHTPVQDVLCEIVIFVYKLKH